jgi:DNA-binding HxlR family transcriptional regulator
VLKHTYDGQHCSIAGTLEIVGERWTLLILRDAFLGVHRFEDLQRRNGVARNVLAARLQRLVDEGLLRRERYSDRPPRDEYRLTEKGVDLWPVIVSLLQWGDKHVNPDEPPVVVTHRGCGGELDDRRMCRRCGAALGPRDVQAVARDPEWVLSPVA